MTVFGKNIYLFQVIAESKDDVVQLAKVADSLKELNKEPKQEQVTKSDEGTKNAEKAVTLNDRGLQDYPIKIAIPKKAERVTKDTPLKVGTKLGCSWANKWYDVEVLELNDDGTVKIHWLKFDAAWDGNISRDNLIISKNVLAKLKKSTGEESGNTAAVDTPKAKVDLPKTSTESTKPKVDPPQAKAGSPKAKTLAEARKGFKTRLTRKMQAKEPVVEPPSGLFNVVKYPSSVGDLAAYLTPDPGDGKKHPALIWITGGDCNTIGDVWSKAQPENDQTASAYRNAGFVMMFPSLRGGNENPGFKEAFFGEVDDVIAAADFLAKQPHVDPQRIYLGGHSSGGTLVLLVAEYTDRFRAVFSFGPTDDVSGYDEEFQLFQRTKTEIELRAPGKWLESIKSPTFVFEAAKGNIYSLLKMAGSTDNPHVVFRATKGADHFSILTPVNGLIVKKLLEDSGPKCNVEISIEEVQGMFVQK